MVSKPGPSTVWLSKVVISIIMPNHLVKMMAYAGNLGNNSNSGSAFVHISALMVFLLEKVITI